MQSVYIICVIKCNTNVNSTVLDCYAIQFLNFSASIKIFKNQTFSRGWKIPKGLKCIEPNLAVEILGESIPWIWSIFISKLAANLKSSMFFDNTKELPTELMMSSEEVTLPEEMLYEFLHKTLLYSHVLSKMQRIFRRIHLFFKYNK